MSVHLLEINDLGVSLSGDHGRVESPGYALLDGAALTLGEQARARARMQPRQVVSQFWSRLGTDPIPNSTARARHHADLAWAHLNALYQEAGKPEELVIAVPSSMNREQLGILLGLAERCEFATVGLVDSAVAAAAGSGILQASVHVDLQLHQCVLTRIDYDGNTLVRSAAEVVPATGWLQLMERWAAMTTAGFVRQCRFDPLHAAQTEQQLYDSIPTWLETLSTVNEITAELNSGNNLYRAAFSRDDFVRAAAPVLTQLATALDRFKADAPLLLSHRAVQIPGIDQLGHPLKRIDHEATLKGCEANIDLLRTTDGTVRFIHRLKPARAPSNEDARPEQEPLAPVPEASASMATMPEPAQSSASIPAASSASAQTASHVLAGFRAHRLLGDGVPLGVSELRWAFGPSPNVVAQIRPSEDGWMLYPDPDAGVTVNAQPIVSASAIKPGDRIGLQGSDLEDLRVIAEQD